MKMGFTIKRLPGYESWYAEQPAKFQAQVEKRLGNVELHGHFGHMRNLGGGVAEIKFNNGARIYFARTGAAEITLLLGGTKNGQDKDIADAKKLIVG
jgi:putative addiction module killer protein